MLLVQTVGDHDIKGWRYQFNFDIGRLCFTGFSGEKSLLYGVDSYTSLIKVLGTG
jgi:hypothetical protein